MPFPIDVTAPVFAPWVPQQNVAQAPPSAPSAVPTDVPVAPARLSNAQLGQSWSSISSSSYSQLFGNSPYVSNGADPQLLQLLGAAVAKSPELQGTPLAAHVQAGRVGSQDIQQLQSFLQSHGHSVGGPGADGKYGPLTHQALEDFLSGNAPSQPAAPQAPQPPTPQPQQPTPSGQSIPKGAPGNSGMTAGAPQGYKPIQGAVDPQVTKMAQSLLGGDFGTETPFQVNGQNYLARVEHHYHPPGYVGGPTGWHKGVTVYQAQ